MSEPLKPRTYNQALADAEEAVIPYLSQENVKVGRQAIRALKLPEPETSDPRDALIKELMGALEPFAVATDRLFGWEHDTYKVFGTPDETLINAGNLRRARNALSKAKGVVS